METSNSFYVHPKALCESTEIGEGTRIWAFAHVMKGAKIGCHCNIGDAAFIESGAVLGDRVTIKNQVMVWDGVTIEDDVFVGPGVIFTNDMFPRSPRMPEIATRYENPDAVARADRDSARRLVGCRRRDPSGGQHRDVCDGGCRGRSDARRGSPPTGRRKSCKTPCMDLRVCRPPGRQRPLPPLRSRISDRTWERLRRRRLMYQGRRIIAIVPAYNEEAKIGNVVTRSPRDVVDELLVIDDGSTDATASVARTAGAEVLSFPQVRASARQYAPGWPPDGREVSILP